MVPSFCKQMGSEVVQDYQHKDPIAICVSIILTCMYKLVQAVFGKSKLHSGLFPLQMAWLTAFLVHMLHPFKQRQCALMAQNQNFDI